MDISEVELMQRFLWIIAASLTLSFLAQLFRSTEQWLASEGTWAFAPGWQREISFWNVGVGTGMIIAAGWGSPETMVTFVVVALVFTLLFGINHLVSWAKASERSWHLLLGVLNLSGTGLGAIVLGANYSHLPF